MQDKKINNIKKIVSTIVGILFLVIGMFNILLIHVVPGLFYLILSFVYFPITDSFLKKKTGYAVPFKLKILICFVVLWGTLAVGDLAELVGL